MKSKTILIIAIFCTVFCTDLCAQTVAGDWYTPLRNKLLHIIITQDSIAFRKCGFDIEMQDYGYVDLRFKIEKVTNNYFIVSNSADTIPAFYWMNFSLADGKNNLNIESLNESFTSVTEVEKAIKLKELSNMNVVLLDKTTIDKIRQLRDISTM